MSHNSLLLVIDDTDRGHQTLSWTFENLSWETLSIVMRPSPDCKLILFQEH